MGSISKSDWGSHSGKQVFLIRMTNRSGAYVELTNYGATLVSVVVPCRQGIPANVVLGFPDLDSYLDDKCYVGSTVGRYANRIADATFTLDNITYQLDQNDGPHSNHGGFSGFNSQVFETQLQHDQVIFHLFSADGAGGYPGNLRFKVSYHWDENCALHIRYEGICDKKTILNVTNHAYFNLSGGNGQIGEHTLKIESQQVLESTAEHIPTGKLKPATAICTVTDKLNHCFILNRRSPNPELAASLNHVTSGRLLHIYTTYPALIVYSGDFLSSNRPGHNGTNYAPLDGLCLECQYLPDSPNQPGFPSTVLTPGTRYREEIIYQFSNMIG